MEHRDAVGGPVLQDALAWDGTNKLRSHEVRNGGLLLSAYTAAYDGGGDRVAAVLNGVPLGSGVQGVQGFGCSGRTGSFQGLL